MKYTARQVAHAYCASLEKKTEKEREALAKRFPRVLARLGMSTHARLILREIEKLKLKEKGYSLVEIEAPDSIPAGLSGEIEVALGKKIHISEKINPDVIAGLRILIDDELFVDASARTQIERLFHKN